MKTDKQYIDEYLALDRNSRIEHNGEIMDKYREFEKMGFEVSSFRSATSISYGSETVYSSRVYLVHFLKSVDAVEEYIAKRGIQ